MLKSDAICRWISFISGQLDTSESTSIDSIWHVASFSYSPATATVATPTFAPCDGDFALVRVMLHVPEVA